MRLVGFVHRDISPGNCLMYERQIKISDLEYARRYESQGKGLAPLTVSFASICSTLPSMTS